MSTSGAPPDPSGDVPYGYAPAAPRPAPPSAPGPRVGPPSEYQSPFVPPARPRGSRAPVIAGIVVIIVLLGVAVGGVVIATRDDEGDGRAGGDGTPSPTVELTQDQRTEALLTIDDVGPGFTQDPDDVEGEPVGEDDFEIRDGACAAAMRESEEAGVDPLSGGTVPEGTASRSFSNDEAGQITHDIAPAYDIVEVYGRLVDACEGVAIGDEESDGAMTMSPGEPLAVGDESLVIDVTFTLESGPLPDMEFNITLVAWTRNGTDSLVSVSPGGDPLTFTGRPVDRGEVERLVARADARLIAVIDGA